MRIDFVDDQFDLLALVIGAGDFQGWGPRRIKYTGDQAMTLCVALQLRISDGIFHDAD